MIKKLSTILILFLFILRVDAANFPPSKYQNISLNKKIYFDTENDRWSYGVNKTNGDYFIKTKGLTEYADYLNSNKDFAFNTNCDFEFINDGNFICYTNKDLNFYKLQYSEGNIEKIQLSDDDMSLLFPNYKIIKISEFSPSTNAYKIKKRHGNLKILLINDTKNEFSDYTFTSGNAKFKKYDLNGFVKIKSAGMLQFSDKQNSPASPWYVLLVR